jgi:FdhE protein
MHGTTASIRPSGRFPDPQVAEPDPAWRPWVRLLDLALEAADAPEWASAVPAASPDRTSGAPLLHGTTLRVDARRARKLLRELLRASHSEPGRPPAAGRRARSDEHRLDVLGVLRGAVTHDIDAIERAASAANVEAGRLAAVAQLAVVPILLACATRFRGEIPSDWVHGYCPVCGAWPALAELRGLERNRRLRCGRCSSDWAIPVLRCPFCDELHHDKLHALLPEGHELTRRVDVCDTCKGYLKAFSTLQAMPLRALAIADLATVELDIVAQERGYERPARLAYPLSVRVERRVIERRAIERAASEPEV